MKGLGTVYRKELSTMFNSAIAYVFIIVFLAVASYWFTLALFNTKRAEMRYFFDAMPWILSIFLPAITMRTWAEEHRQGTIELLMTLPMKLSSIVLGKYLACLTFFLMMLAATGVIPILLTFLWKADSGPIAAGYLGTAAVGALYLSIGTYISAHTRDQIVALILALVACLFLVLIGIHFFTDWMDGWFRGLGTFIREQFGVVPHLDSFQKGVVDLSDLFFFLSLAGMFVGLNIFTLASRTNVREGAQYVIAGALLSGIGIFLALNFNEARVGRLDMTEARLYTVSPASARILSRLRGPVTITYYVTNAEKLPPDFKQLERDVTDLLRELSKVSPHITFHVEDPSTNPAAESKLKELGIKPQTATVMEKDQAQLSVVYSALLMSYLDKPDEPFPWIDPGQLGNLEFELVSKLHRLTLDRKPKVAFFAKIEEVDPRMRMMGRMPPDEYKEIAGILREQGYDVSRIALNSAEPIPADADALIVLAPEGLNERQIYEINRFVRSGRPAFLGIQKYLLDYESSFEGVSISPHATSTGIDRLLEAWGVTAEEEVLMDATFFPVFKLPLPMQIRVARTTMNSEVSALNGVEEMLYMWGASLKVQDKAGLKSTVVATTSARSWKVPARVPFFSREDIQPERAKYLGRLPIMVWLEGTFPDACAGKPVPAWPDGGAGEIKGEPNAGPAQVVIAGSAVMFSNRFLLPGNVTFLLNSLDILTHGEDLAQIRAKAYAPKSIGDLTPGEVFFYRFLLVAGMPLALVVVGIVRLVMRRSAREAYLKSVVKA